MKTIDVSQLFILLVFLQLLAVANKALSIRMVRKVMKTGKLPLWPFIIPIGNVMKGAKGEEAIRIAKSYAFVADLFLWFSVIILIVAVVIVF